jgi:toxin ParE1/3/4
LARSGIVIYRTTLRADADIIDIFVESAARYGVRHAQNYVEGLAATLALLAENPLMARERLESTRRSGCTLTART